MFLRLLATPAPLRTAGKTRCSILMLVCFALALCAGGTILSHVNDAGFWIVNEYFGMTVPQTLRTWTTMKVITSLTGIVIIMLIGKYI